MILITLTGPSCSGKTTTLNKMVASGEYSSLVSHTTRKPRPGEVEGKDYFFVSDADFLDKLDNGGFIESVEFNGFRYGISVDQLKLVSDQGKTPVLIVEPNGLKQIFQYCQFNGIELMMCYIGGVLKDLIARYLNRADHLDFADTKRCEQHATRLQSIVTECVEWRKAMPYYVYINESNAETLDSDIEFITSSLNFMKEENGKS
jgi:guanylate kinase